MSGDNIVMKSSVERLKSLGINLSVANCLQALGFTMHLIIPGARVIINYPSENDKNNNLKVIVEKLSLLKQTNSLADYSNAPELYRRMIILSILDTKLSFKNPKSTCLESLGLDASKVLEFQAIVLGELNRISISNNRTCNTISDVIGGFVGPSGKLYNLSSETVFRPLSPCVGLDRSKSPFGLELPSWPKS